MAAHSRGTERTEQAISFSSPQEEALLTLMRTSDTLHRAFQLRLKPFKITANQYNVLRILRAARPTGLTCSAIGQRMITPEPDITRLLGRMKAHGLLSQHRDPADRRVVWTEIRDKGMEVLASLDSVVDQAPRELFRQLSCQEIQYLMKLLRKVQSCPDAEATKAEKVTFSGTPHAPQPTRLHPRPE